MVFSLGGAALGAGMGLASSYLTQQAHERAQSSEARALNRQLRKRRRSPFGRALKQSVNQLSELATSLPGQMRADLTGQLQSNASQQQANLNQRLAATGATAGGDVFGRSQRSLLDQLNRARTGIETDVARTESGLLGQLAGVSQRAGEFLRPITPVQEKTYIDPMGVVNAGLMGGVMGGRYGGSGQTPGGPAFNPANMTPLMDAPTSVQMANPTLFNQNQSGDPFGLLG